MLTGRAGGLARAAAGLAGPRGPGAVRGRAGRCGPSASGLPPALPLPPVWQGPPRPPLAVDPLPRASVNGSRRGPGPGGCGLSRPSRPRRCRGPGGALRGLGLRPLPRPPSPSRLAGPPRPPLAVDPLPRASVNGSRWGPGPGGCGLSRPSRPRRCRGPGGALRGLGLRPLPRPPSPSRLAGPPRPPLAVDPLPRASVNGSRRGPGPGGCGLSRPSRPRRCRGPGGALRGLGLRPSPRPPSPSVWQGPRGPPWRLIRALGPVLISCLNSVDVHPNLFLFKGCSPGI